METKTNLKLHIITGFIMFLFLSNVVFIAMLATSKGENRHLENIIVKKDSIHAMDSCAIYSLVNDIGGVYEK